MFGRKRPPDRDVVRIKNEGKVERMGIEFRRTEGEDS